MSANSWGESETVVQYNSFINIDGIALKLWPGHNNSAMTATENYWGTTDTSIIDSMIYDKNDDITCAGYIDYLPILTEPHPETPVPGPTPPLPEPPEVTANAATDYATTSPTLNGNLDDLGTASSVDVSFEWGLDGNYGNETTPQTMTSPGAFSAELSDLTPYETYHFRAKAFGDGTSYGEDMSFFVFIAGDANLDGIVDGRDVIRTKKMILGIE